MIVVSARGGAWWLIIVSARPRPVAVPVLSRCRWPFLRGGAGIACIASSGGGGAGAWGLRRFHRKAIGRGSGGLSLTGAPLVWCARCGAVRCGAVAGSPGAGGARFFWMSRILVDGQAAPLRALGLIALMCSLAPLVLLPAALYCGGCSVGNVAKWGRPGPVPGPEGSGVLGWCIPRVSSCGARRSVEVVSGRAVALASSFRSYGFASASLRSLCWVR